MYIKNLKKKCQEKWENAYLTVRNTRASRTLRWALDPSQYWLTSLARLHFAMSAKSWKKFLGPPLTKSWIRYCKQAKMIYYEKCDIFDHLILILLSWYSRLSVTLWQRYIQQESWHVVWSDMWHSCLPTRWHVISYFWFKTDITETFSC